MRFQNLVSQKSGKELLPSYRDFIVAYPKYQKFADNADAQQVFEFLRDPETLLSMIKSCQQGKPALSGCAEELDKITSTLQDFNYHNTSKDDPLYLEKNVLKQAIGSMIRVLLAPFSLLPSSKRRVNPALTPNFFSATHYALTGVQQLQFEIAVTEIDLGREKL